MELATVRTSGLSWGAVLGGWAVAAASAMVLYALGAAGGITALRLTDPDSITQAVAISSAVWLLISWVISLSLGGYFAGLVSRAYNRHVGCRHGVAVWAVSTLLTLFAGLTGLGAAGMAGIAATGQAADVMSHSRLDAVSATDARGSSGSGIPTAYQAALRERIGPAWTEDYKTGSLTQIAAEFLRGDEQSAKNALVLHTSMTSDEAERIVDDMSGQTTQVKAKLKDVADKVATYTSAALWLSVLVGLLSLAGAAFAGRSGALDALENKEIYS